MDKFQHVKSGVPGDKFQENVKSGIPGDTFRENTESGIPGDSFLLDTANVRQVEEYSIQSGSTAKQVEANWKVELDRITASMPEHLQDLFARSCDGLTEEQSIQVGGLLKEYQDVFAKHDLDLGCFTEVKHHINTGDAAPVKHKLRRTPLGFEGEEEKHLEKLTKAEVIRDSTSEWASAPVLIRKKDGTVRWCIDYRALNAKTIKDSFPLPNIGDCLDALAGNQYFSTLDMASGYYQIELAEEDRKKTAFITRLGQHEHTRMGFGLCNAPATFQRAMQLVLRGLTWKEALAYLDDINVLGQSFENHLSNLRHVLDRLRKYNLKLKPKKCNLFRIECEFLGKLVNREGVQITASKIRAVKDWPVPTNKTEVESFLGFSNYHRDHVQGYAGISKCLYELTGKCPTFAWEEKHQETFERIKTALTSAPCLSYPRKEGTFILDADASQVCIGAELSQQQDGQEKVVCYASRVLTPVQRRYCTTRKELLAVVTFCRQFRHYLLGSKFIVRTDHSSLVWLLRFKNPDGQLARWMEELAQYDLQIMHRSGSKHSNADGLSRIPDRLSQCDCYRAGVDVELLPCGGCSYCTRAHQQWARFEEDVDDVVPLARRSPEEFRDENASRIRVIGISEPDVMDGDPVIQNEACNWLEGYSVQESQRSDQDLLPIIQWLEQDLSPTTPEVYLHSPTTKALWLCKAQLMLKDGVLYYRWENKPERRCCLVVPKSLVQEVLHHCHDVKNVGHMGYKKTLQTLKRSFLWYQMAKDCRIYVESCATCNRNKKISVNPRAPLQRYHAGYPMERVHLDILGPFTPSEQGNVYILVMIDQFTKWIECVALPDAKAERVAQEFLIHFVVTFGCPLEVHTDQGSNFNSNLFRSFCDLFDIVKTRTTPYHPSSNGQVERVNRTLLQMIRCYIEGRVRQWDKDLSLLVMALHATENRSTGFTPNMMMLGREVMTPIDLMMGTAQVNLEKFKPAEWVDLLLKTLADTHAFARQELRATQYRQKRDYDLRIQVRKYEVGDLVYMKDDATKVGESKKLRPPWKGPYVVVKSDPPLYTVRGRKGDSIIHHDRLKKCLDREVPIWLRRARNRLFQSLETVSLEEDLVDEFERGSDNNVLEDVEVLDGLVLPKLFKEAATKRQSTKESEKQGPEEQEPQEQTSKSDPIVTGRSRVGRKIVKPGWLKEYDSE